MPTGNEEVWMIRVRDRGQLYKIDLLELLKKAGFTHDAYGRELPQTRVKLKTEEPKKEDAPKLKKVKKDE